VSGGNPLNWDSEQRLRRTESQGVVAEVLFPNTSPPFFPSGAITAPGPRDQYEYDHRMAGLRAHNRWLAEFCSATPGRRAGLAQVFLDDIDAAVAEVTWARHAGLRGVLLPHDHVQKMMGLYYPEYDRFWAACADLDMPVIRHTAIGVEDPKQAGIGAAWVGQQEATFFFLRGLAHLICTGVFERFPALTFVMAEGLRAAELPAYVQGLDQTWTKLRRWRSGMALQAALALPRLPSEYFQTNVYVAAPLDLKASIDADVPNLMFGTDLPHSEGMDIYAVDALRLCLADQPIEAIMDVTHRRAADVFGFDLDGLQQVADEIGPSYRLVQTPLARESWPAYPAETRCSLFAPKIAASAGASG
jgi:predicted TIM-barrel fold metal-dependent hydrolase